MAIAGSHPFQKREKKKEKKIKKWDIIPNCTVRKD